jgi:branched-chain amino acid transport system permease protein
MPLDLATLEHAVGVTSDLAIMSLLALSAYVMLLVGRVSFGQQAFFGLGAYASGLLTAMAHWPLAAALVVGAAVGAGASVLLALPTLRLSGLHYAVATLAFGEMVRVALMTWTWQVDPGDGMPVGPAGTEGFRDIRWLLENDVSPARYLLLVLAVLVALLLVLASLERRRLGVGWRMLGHDATLAAAQGLPVLRLRLAAAGLAGALAALGGGLYAHRATYIEPSLFDPMLGVHAVGYALIGGLGTALGPIVGVLIDLGLLEATRLFQGWRMVVFGGLVALFLRWRPRGLLDEALVQRLGSRLKLGARVGAHPLRWSAGVVFAVLGLAAAAANAQTPSRANQRAQATLTCTSHGDGPQLDCVLQLRQAGQPLSGAQVKVGAHMPSMPMAHSVKPVAATAGDAAGEYRAALMLEMEGVWALSIDVSVPPLRDRIVKTLDVADCPRAQRCPALPPSAGKGTRP